MSGSGSGSGGSDIEENAMPLEASQKAEMETLKKRLLTLREKRRNLEKELDSTMEEYFPTLSVRPSKAAAEAASVENKKLYYERMGVKVRVNKTAKEGKMFVADLLNWFDGEVVLKFYIMGTLTKKSYFIKEHNITKNICKALDDKELPWRVPIEEGKAFLNKVFQSVSAFFERSNQCREVDRQSMYNLKCSWSVDCREIQIKTPLSCCVRGKNKIDIDVMFALKYSEKAITATDAAAYLCKTSAFYADAQCNITYIEVNGDADDDMMSTHVRPKLQHFYDEFLMNAFTSIFEEDLERAEDEESGSS